PHRPAVGGDVVHQDHHDVLDLRDLEELHADGDLAGQVEAVPGCGGHRLGELLLADPAHLKLRAGDDGVEDPLLRKAVGGGEHGAKRLVAGDDVADGVGQGDTVKAAAEAQGDGDVVGGGGSLQLVKEPQPHLGVGQRDDLRALADRE